MGAKVPENKRSRKRSSSEEKFQGTNWPRSELARERKCQGVIVPGNEKARYRVSMVRVILTVTDRVRSRNYGSVIFGNYGS